MSHPKSGPIIVQKASPEELARREAERRKKQQEKIERAEARAKERQRAIEADRQRAIEREIERANRRKALEEARQLEIAATKARAEQARVDQLHLRGSRLLERAQVLAQTRQHWSAKLSKLEVATDIPTDKMPIGITSEAMETWCTVREHELEQYATALTRSIAAGIAGKASQTLVNELCASIDPKSRSVASVLAGFDAVINLPHDKEVAEELRRQRQIFSEHEKVLTHSAVSQSTVMATNATLWKLGDCKSIQETRQHVNTLLALFAAAQGEIDQQENLAKRVNALISEWESFSESVPSALSASLSRLSSVTDNDLNKWEAECKSASLAAQAQKEADQKEQREADRKLIAIGLRQALENLGYEVEPIEHTMFVNGGRIFATKPSWAGHFVEISGTTTGKDDRLGARCVRLPSSAQPQNQRVDASRDVEWCDDLHVAMGALKNEGIHFSIDAIDRTKPIVAELSADEVVCSPLVNRRAKELKANPGVQTREQAE